VWGVYILIGIIGKFSHDLIMGKRLTWVQVFASIGIALFCGFLASVICMHNFPDKAAYIVPIATLLSEKIVVAILAVDYKMIASEFANYWADKFKK
jgi:hypothetical protein